MESGFWNQVAGVVGSSTNDASAIRVSGAILNEQNREWVVRRRYLSEDSMALVASLSGTDQTASLT